MEIKANDFACRTDVLSGLTCYDPGATEELLLLPTHASSYSFSTAR
jgi:hypothetical protein